MKRLLALAAIVVVVSACRVDVLVELDVREDGSGTVTIEAAFDEAASAAAGDLGQRLRLDDLAAAGWEVTIGSEQSGSTGATAGAETTREAEGADDEAGDPADEATEPSEAGEGTDPSDAAEQGSLTLTFRKAVPSAGQWQEVLDEIAGPGVFADVRVESASELGEYTRRLVLEVDLSEGWMLLADGVATDVFGGEPFGVPVEELTGGRSIDEVVGIEVRAIVSSDDASPPAASVFSPRFDQTGSLLIAVESVSESSLPVLLRWVGFATAGLFVLASLLAIMGLVLQRRSDRLRRAQPEPMTSRVPPDPAGGTRLSTRAGVDTAGPAVRLVVLEPRSVLFQQSRTPDAYILPFVRHNGGDARADTIMDAYDDVIVGRMQTGEFWKVCGVEGEADAVDDVFARMRWLRPGAQEFLNETQRRRIPIAAVTSDAVPWSQIARDRERLTAVWPWLISAEIGARMPDPGMFEILGRETGVGFEHCLYVDTDLENLDIARALGMRTTLFDPDRSDVPKDHGHPRVDDLRRFFGRRSRAAHR